MGKRPQSSSSLSAYQSFFEVIRAAPKPKTLYLDVEPLFQKPESLMRAKRSLWMILIVLVGGAAAAGATAAYYWQRATAVPTWYDSRVGDEDWAASVSSNSELWRSQLAAADINQTVDGRQVEIQLTEAEVNQLLQAELSQLPTDDSVREITQGLRASLEDDRLQAGLLVNPSELPLEDLPPDAQQTLQPALNALPLLEDQEFYVGITGSPRVENGQLVWGDDTRFQIGRLRLSLAEAARLAGISPAELTERINAAINQSGMTLDDLSIVDGQVILRGTAQ